MKKQGLKYDVVVITIAPNYGNSAGKIFLMSQRTLLDWHQKLVVSGNKS
ncbi:hypothetical protein F441_08954 [Phytophthora nicotianae CJ01A1]|uniref:Uncharacterized protein n=2 Tax=Phytophthora nicotianae TaxID=4792 RepID=W2X1J9_PHYNI|nr:hypothetical protein L916_08740 [Phytophthora nicotianae]ETP16432.1 hypothetical protein F441_08954 [Phytophthora nicotianae CJ01A1]